LVVKVWSGVRPYDARILTVESLYYRKSL
jgi:hypothetical protein